MEHLNVEIKAKSEKNDKIREELKAQNAYFKGMDHQIDTYFKVAKGRLKLREGDIENNLIHYERNNQKGPKQASIILYKNKPDSSLKKLLSKALEIWLVVDKEREIYFIDNVKIHLDEVKRLGSFMEIEAIDSEGTIGLEKLEQQCEYYMDLFGIKSENLISHSYSDLMAEKTALT